MRHLRRLLLVAAVVTVGLMTPAPEAQAGYFCWESGNCQYCCDDFSGCCTAICDPGGDSWWC
jgi:hypothetical protein